ncbi:hypothetical protein D4R86_05985 [bacterium]|nr:MAG: hypothetical protein D4R86_05985 [bacterium]
MSRNIQLLAIDVQNDFASVETDSQGRSPTLFVPGADQDTIRLVNLINRLDDKISDIHVTMDSHRSIQIFFSSFWCDSRGKNPDPFTVISVDDVESGAWTTVNPGWKQRAIDYVRALAERGRNPLCVWPYHTMIGSWGASLVPIFSNALIKWEQNNFAVVDYITKGTSLMTEHYSIVAGEVIDPADPHTMINTGLIETLQEADEVLLSGQALSHCVRNSVLDIIDNFGEENINKLVLLTDTSSNVPGFESLGTSFVREATARGMRTTTSTDYLA